MNMSVNIIAKPTATATNGRNSFKLKVTDSPFERLRNNLQKSVVNTTNTMPDANPPLKAN